LKTLALVLAFASVLLAESASAQVIGGVPMSGEETITVSSSAIGVTANLCGGGNMNGAMGQVTSSAGIYAAFHSTSATPDSGDFVFAQYDVFFVKPANQLRMIRSSGSDATVKIQCVK
jgi:hypothetical protein